jgi:hypothetical protein
MKVAPIVEAMKPREREFSPLVVHKGPKIQRGNVRRVLATAERIVKALTQRAKLLQLSGGHCQFQPGLIFSAENQEKSLPIGRSLLKFTLRTTLPVFIATIICLLMIEVGIRVAYKIRNSRVEYVMLPYMVRNFGPVPPWANGLRILEPDDELMLRGRPHAQQKYLDLFSP